MGKNHPLNWKPLVTSLFLIPQLTLAGPTPTPTPVGKPIEQNKPNEAAEPVANAPIKPVKPNLPPVVVGKPKDSVSPFNCTFGTSLSSLDPSALERRMLECESKCSLISDLDKEIGDAGKITDYTDAEAPSVEQRFGVKATRYKALLEKSVKQHLSARGGTDRAMAENIDPALKMKDLLKQSPKAFKPAVDHLDNILNDAKQPFACLSELGWLNSQLEFGYNPNQELQGFHGEKYKISSAVDFKCDQFKREYGDFLPEIRANKASQKLRNKAQREGRKLERDYQAKLKAVEKKLDKQIASLNRSVNNSEKECRKYVKEWNKAVKTNEKAASFADAHKAASSINEATVGNEDCALVKRDAEGVPAFIKDDTEFLPTSTKRREDAYCQGEIRCEAVALDDKGKKIFGSRSMKVYVDAFCLAQVPEKGQPSCPSLNQCVKNTVQKPATAEELYESRRYWKKPVNVREGRRAN